MSTEAGRASGRHQIVLLAGAFFASSALGLLLLAVLARWLTPAENAQFLAWWGLLFAFASVLGSVEQEVARQSAEATMDGRRVPRGAAQMVLVVTAGSFLVFGVLVATPAGRTATAESAVVVLFTYLALSGFAVQIATRGLLLGESSYLRYVVVILGEALIRAVVAAVVVLQGVEASVEWAVLITTLGSFAWLPVARHAFARVEWRGPRFAWRRVVSTVAALALANGLSALVLTGYPAVAAVAIGAADELGNLFAAVTIARVPLVLLAPVQALTVPTVVRWVRRGRVDKLRRATSLVALGSAVGALLAALLAYEFGPGAVRIAMGEQYDAAGSMCALVAAAAVLMAAALLQAGVLVALKRYWHLTACWALATASAGAVLAGLPAEPEARGAWGFLVAALVSAIATRGAIGRISAHPPDDMADADAHA
ncbi:hypothetical protein [Nocardioides soli]|uniref:O-antigen/teichoic acid export membrane protein n=1 Tax=Nocardioides soli TaxID=1036020 RepID=A0A7W4VY53_9ACTN|nr:hypothetical protein [Nocardioides soli]MBB3043529.1 O-antigen/teichoic acid export membrane protein [Nocardioides soli]